LGEKTVEQLVSRDMVKDLADLYRLEPRDIEQLDRFAQKSARKLYHSIQRSKKTPLDRFLYALGMRHVGRRMARQLARAFGSLDSVRNAKLSDLKATADIGPETARSIRDFFDEDTNRRVLDRLERVGVKVQDGERISGAERHRPLADKTFVFTGELEGYSRAEAQDTVERLGGRATSSVSSKTDYVVVGESPGGKLDDAKRQGVEILNEAQFERLIQA